MGDSGALESHGSVLDQPATGQPVLFWQNSLPGSNATEEVLCDFQDAEFVREFFSTSSSQSRKRFLTAGTFRSMSLTAGRHYAFAFNCQASGFHNLRSNISSSNCNEDRQCILGPLEVLYMTRLCALDDGHEQPSQLDFGSSFDAGGSCPPHLQCSDELLFALLTPGSKFGTVETAH